MMYYVWMVDWHSEEACNIVVPSGWSRYNLYTCNRIEENVPWIHIHADTRGNLTDAILNHQGFLAFSSRLRDVISSVTHDRVQYLDATVFCEKEKVQIEDYKVANPLVHLDAIDLERSVFEYMDEEEKDDIFSIDRLVLDESRIGDHSFFRLSNFAAILVVGEKVANAVTNSGCTGVRFVPVSTYRV